MTTQYMEINNKKVEITGKEKNILEVARGMRAEIPTFCYHSEL